MYDKTTLGLEEALQAVTAVIRAAENVGSREPRTWPGIAVTVVDKEGELVAGARMDGMAPRFFKAAHRKAYTAAVMERDTAGVMEFWNRQEAAGHRGPHDWNDPMLTTLPGGYVVKHGTKIVGAIGISGGSSGEYDDEYFADIAMKALGDDFRHTLTWDRKRVGDLPGHTGSNGRTWTTSRDDSPTISDTLDRLCPATGRTAEEGQAPAGRIQPAPAVRAGRAVPAMRRPLLSAGQPPQSPQGMGTMVAACHRRAVAASHLVHHGRPGPPHDDQTRLVHASCRRGLSARQRRKPGLQHCPFRPPQLLIPVPRLCHPCATITRPLLTIVCTLYLVLAVPSSREVVSP